MKKIFSFLMLFILFVLVSVQVLFAANIVIPVPDALVHNIWMILFGVETILGIIAMLFPNWKYNSILASILKVVMSWLPQAVLPTMLKRFGAPMKVAPPAK